MLREFQLDKEAFSKRFRQLFKASGLSQTELADAVGVTQTAISYWLNGKNEPSFGDVVRISIVLKIDVSEFAKDATEDVAVSKRGRPKKPAPLEDAPDA